MNEIYPIKNERKIFLIDMDVERIKKQIDFIIEIDKLKKVERKTTLIDKSRYENAAEHSWHLAIMALLLWEHAQKDKIDLLKVIKMVIIHDLVEIDAGDTFAYDVEGYKDKNEREKRAADRIFTMLPKDQAEELYDLWEEFEMAETEESKFANAIDRLQPMLYNYYTKGGTWKKYNVSLEQVLKRFEGIRGSSDIIEEFALDIINESVKKGYIQK